MIAHILEGLARPESTQAIVVTGYLGEQIEDAGENLPSQKPGNRNHHRRQPELNGTGGAMIAAMPLLGAEPRSSSDGATY